MKVIYDQTTGLIRATCLDAQNYQEVMSNYSDVDYIQVNELPWWTEWPKLRVDLTTKQLVPA